MKEQTRVNSTLKPTLHKLVRGVHLAGITAQTRQQGLSIILWGFLAGLIFLSLASQYNFIEFPGITRDFLSNTSLFLILVVLVLILANRAGYTRSCGLVFLVLVNAILVVAIPFSALNEVLILFTLPVLAASFVISPFSAILLAALSSLSYTLAWLNTNSQEFYNYPSLIVLGILAFSIWQISARMESAIRQMRKTEHKLQSEIKEHRETEEELEQRNRDLSTLLDSLPGFAFFKDTDFRYITANQTFCDAIGCTKEQLKGKTDFDLLPRRAALDYRAADMEIFRTGIAILDIEMEMRDPKGSERILVATRKVPLRNDEGIIIGMIGLGYDITARKIAEEQLRLSHEDLMQAYSATLEGWAHALEMREQETAGHSQRVVESTLQLAKVFGVCESNCAHIQRGAFLHDIGKMGIPDHILLKPGPLNDDEWRIMRRHPQMAYDLLYPIPYLRPALDIPYCHHEKWDGSGYPRGLKGEDIPLFARIFSIVDVWDALSSHRPYREPWPEEKVLDYLREQSGLHFDPQVVEAFIQIRAKNIR